MAIAYSIVGQSSFSLRPSVVATVVEDGAVLLDLESKYFYHLNETAWAITQLFESDGVSAEEIETTCRRWGAVDTASVRSFLDAMERESLIEEAPNAGALQGAHQPSTWIDPVLERQSQPLQSVVTSAFDPSVPLAE